MPATVACLCCRYTFSCSSSVQRALLLRLQQRAVAEQQHLAAPDGGAAMLLQPWRNVTFNGHRLMPQLLTDLRRLAMPACGTLSLDFVSHAVRASPDLPVAQLLAHCTPVRPHHTVQVGGHLAQL